MQKEENLRLKIEEAEKYAAQCAQVFNRTNEGSDKANLLDALNNLNGLRKDLKDLHFVAPNPPTYKTVMSKDF